MVILQKLNKFSWVCKTIFFQHIFLMFQEISKSQSNIHSHLQPRQNSWGRNGFFFFSPFSLCLCQLPVGSSGSRNTLQNFIAFLVFLWLLSFIQWGTLRLQMDNPLEQPYCPPMATHRRVTCTLPLTIKTEFPEDLLGCSSKESFRDHHLLQLASTLSLFCQHFY